MSDTADLEYGRIAVKNNFVSEKEMEKCFQLKKNLRKRSGKDYRLGDLLIEKGLLSDEEDRAVSRAMQRIQESARKRRVTDKNPIQKKTSGKIPAASSKLELLEDPEAENPRCGQCEAPVASGSSRCEGCNAELCPGCQTIRVPGENSCGTCGSSFSSSTTRRRRPPTRGSARQRAKNTAPGNLWLWVAIVLLVVSAIFLYWVVG
ncbi:MAG: zinc ribbon domain-containing protein [Planctomycetota bacterium]|jgi:hypothetical protein|nr:zinc ribbon domain-containing protein [Planctomycetota bacterium]